MKLVLARHGNTFGPGDTPVWVGAKEDFPLVEKGLQQAHDVADALIRSNLRPTAIIAGPLLRTKVGAEIIAEDTGFAGNIRIDDRLKEIDYGSWGGKSDAEITELYGSGVMEAWREDSLRPANADWLPDETVLQSNAMSVLTEIRAGYSENDVVLLISSNGILRFYHAALYEGCRDAPSGKVKTGHMCLADIDGDAIKPVCWNSPPKDF